MAIVKLPFFSAWASGSLGKQITCKAFNGNKYVMYKHIPLRRKLNEEQIKWKDDFVRRAKLMKMYRDNIDIAVSMTEFHFKE